MSDLHDVPDLPRHRPVRRSAWDRVSIVWLVPVLALLVALGVAWQNYANRGPVIEIIFDSAAGVTKDETEVRFRDVAVGIVEDVSFTEELDRVIVAVRLDPKVAPYVDDRSEFWIVRPEVTAQGVTGLDTVLSGVYIEGQWDDDIRDLTYEFLGLSDAPLLVRGEEGVRITMRTTDGSLSGNVPIVFKGVEVGQVGPAVVSDDGFSVTAQAVVYAPHDNLVTSATRFWDTSGFSVSIGASGAAVDFDSVASLLAGGITFDTFVSGAELAQNGDIFPVFSGPDAARASIFDSGTSDLLDVVAIFDGNVAGLATGAIVEFNGLRIGEVTGLNGVVEDMPTGETNVRLQTVLSIEPARLGLAGAENANDALTFLDGQVRQGMRARLATGSLLTGGLIVQLVTLPDVADASINRAARPYPEIPTTESDIIDVASTAQGTLTRINELKIEELIASATLFLNNAGVLVGSETTQAVPGDVSALLGEMRAVVGSDGVQALPGQFSALMTDLEATVEQVQAVLVEIQEQEVVASLALAVRSTDALIVELDRSLDGVPDLLTQITTLAENAGSLPLEALVTQITGLSIEATTLLASDGVQGLPGDVSQLTAALTETLAEARVLVADLNASDATTRLLAAVDAASGAAATVETSFAGVPGLIEQLNGIAANAQDLELDALIAQVTGLVDSADVLISSDTTRALPGTLNVALAEMRAVLSDLREGGAVENTNAALSAAADAADAIAQATQGVPEVLRRANALIAQAEQTLSGFEETSPAIRDARDALREVQEAADAVQSLTRTIERSPLLRR